MSGFILSAEAAADIEDIVRYIAYDNVSAALALEDELIANFRELARFPNSGHARHDLAGTRELLFWTVGSYLVLYRVKSKRIEIVAVLHGGRDIPKILARRGA